LSGKLIPMLSTNDLKNRLLPNNLIIIRNIEEDHRGHVGHRGGARELKDRISRPKEGEYEPIKILQKNMSYVLN
jgi:hypothetical protein